MGLDEPSFSEVDIPLHEAQRLVIDLVLVPKLDERLAFNLQCPSNRGMRPMLGFSDLDLLLRLRPQFRHCAPRQILRPGSHDDAAYCIACEIGNLCGTSADPR